MSSTVTSPPDLAKAERLRFLTRVASVQVTPHLNTAPLNVEAAP